VEKKTMSALLKKDRRDTPEGAEKDYRKNRENKFQKKILRKRKGEEGVYIERWRLWKINFVNQRIHHQRAHQQSGGGRERLTGYSPGTNFLSTRSREKGSSVGYGGHQK